MNDNKSDVLFIGLGAMGYHMAGHLVANKYKTYVYNRTSSKAEAWCSEFSGQAVTDLSSLPENIKCIISCIGDDNDLRQIYLSENGLIPNCRPGTLFIDHTTASAQVARELEQAAAKHDMQFIDAPVSGGVQGAENGQLTIMCGGDNDAYRSACQYMNCYAKAINLMGPSGSGQLTKMSNQMAVAGVLQGLAEALHFAEQADLDCNKVIDVISKGAAQSWQMDNRARNMIAGKYDYGFAVDLIRKDLRICLEESRHVNAKLPVTALLDQFYGDVQEMGGGRWDTSSLLERLRPQKKDN